MIKQQRPTKADLLAAHGRAIDDVIRRELSVLFCGINPGLYSGAVGHHFARPGNRFWPALYASGFTHRLLSPFEENDLLAAGFGITNIVNRATASAAELSAEELTKGAEDLVAKLRYYRPKCLAVLGIGAYRSAFGNREAKLGLQQRFIGGSIAWVLPNPSGLNAHYQPQDLARLFLELRIAIEDQ